MFEKPSKEIRHQFERYLWIGQVLGVATFDGKDINPRLIFTLLMGALEQVMQFHGLRQSWPNFSYICNSMVIYCVVIQILVRLGSKFVNDDDNNLLSLLDVIEQFYEREEKIPEHRSVLTKNLKILKLIQKSYLIFWFTLFCVPNSTAWLISWYYGELIFFTPIYLPFLDSNSIIGYIINSTLLFYYTMLVYFCLMIGEINFIYLIYQCVPTIDIYCLKIQKLSEDLIKIKTTKDTKLNQIKLTSKSLTERKKIDKKQQDVFNIEKQLIDLIKEFNVYNNYIKSATKYMKYTIFVALSMNAIAIAMSIVVILYYSKAIGVVIIFIPFFQVLMPCVQGSLITHLKEKILNELYSFPWYEFSKHNQKIFLQFIHLCQNSNEFEIPIIGILDMEIFTDAMNGTYSYFVCLQNYVKV